MPSLFNILTNNSFLFFLRLLLRPLFLFGFRTNISFSELIIDFLNDTGSSCSHTCIFFLNLFYSWFNSIFNFAYPEGNIFGLEFNFPKLILRVDHIDGFGCVVLVTENELHLCLYYTLAKSKNILCILLKSNYACLIYYYTMNIITCIIIAVFIQTTLNDCPIAQYIQYRHKKLDG